MSLLPAGDGDRFGDEAVLVMEFDDSISLYIFHETTQTTNRKAI